jgi:hypothetical protein
MVNKNMTDNKGRKCGEIFKSCSNDIGVDHSLK